MEVDPPPPYTAHSNGPTGQHTPPSTVASLPSSTRSSSLSSLPTEDSKNTHTLAQEVLNNSEGHADAQQPANSSTARETPLPPDTMRARAPLEVVKKNQSIVSNLLLTHPKESRSKSADIRLQTKNSKITSAVYVDDADWGRPVTIEAETKNSSLALAVHTLRSGQAVNIYANTKNASASLLLPQDFTGLLIMSTTNGKDAISTRLQKVAVLVPNQQRGTGDSDHEMWYEINGSNGPSRAVIKTKNGSVGAGLIGDEDEIKNSSCLIM